MMRSNVAAYCSCLLRAHSPRSEEVFPPISRTKLLRLRVSSSRLAARVLGGTEKRAEGHSGLNHS